MELTPQTLHAVEFREARRGGYNTRDVDDFLERVAAGVGLLQDRLREAMARAEGAEGRLADMQRQLEEAQRRSVAPQPQGPAPSETDDTLRRTLVLAQRTADATIKEAKDEAARLLSEAREEASRTRSEVEAEARRGTEDARLAAEAEIEHLIETRDALKGDLDAMGHQVERQREQVRAGIAELERVLDDPSALRAVGPPPMTEVEPPPSRPLIEAPGALQPRGSAPSPSPAPAPALPMRNPQPAEIEVANGNGGSEPISPFQLGAQVAALQEAPPLPSRPKPDAPGPAQAPAPPAPFGSFPGGPADGSPSVSPWPSELRTSVAAEEAPGAPPAPGGVQQPAENGAVEGIGIEPGSRPSEWGKPVFDRADDTDPRAQFGRRNG